MVFNGDSEQVLSLLIGLAIETVGSLLLIAEAIMTDMKGGWPPVGPGIFFIGLAIIVPTFLWMLGEYLHQKWVVFRLRAQAS